MQQIRDAILAGAHLVDGGPEEFANLEVPESYLSLIHI